MDVTTGLIQAETSEKYRLLLIEDNMDEAQIIGDMIASQQTVECNLTHVDCLVSALTHIKSTETDIILLDLNLPDSKGLNTFKKVMMHAPEIPIVILSGHDDDALAIEAMHSGAQDYLIKGDAPLPVLTRSIRYAIERKRAEQVIRQSETRYRAIIQHAPCGILRSSYNGRLIYINSTLSDMLGYSSADDVINTHTLSDLFIDDDTYQSIMTQLRSFEQFDHVEAEWRRADETSITVRLSGRVIEEIKGEFNDIELLIEDITDRRNLEKQLHTAQKMEAIGQLAGGVAHDFNNLLSVINGYADITLGNLSPGHPLRSNIEEIKKAGEQAAALTQQLLGFSRRQMRQTRVLALNTVIQNSAKMLRRLIREDISLTLNLSGGLGNVKADPGQLEQILINLVVNARDAMPQGGSIIIETENRDLDSDFVRHHMGSRTGAYVMLAIQDTGIGMSKKVQEKIFLPFYTTKEPGKGTGLGLATVYGIVKQNDGYIDVESEEGVGTVFRIYLPRLIGETMEREQEPEQHEIPRGTETILVVEDEEKVRRLVKKILTGSGYAVIEASDGDEALQICTHRKTPVSLILTDMVMPQMSGPNLAKILADISPHTKMLFMSGYTDDDILDDENFIDETVFIQKPFTPATLVQKVREILDG